MGILATVGQWVGVKALKLGEASVVGNMEYTKLIYAGLFGFVLFSEVPDVYKLIGASIIIGAAIYIFRREAVRKEPN
ncbi:MAG: drug/metabolite transporter (DMT)-like permease [Planctomycetota bacterium]|jgi:drug/metabolite transporter (DMT)-like permease